jgi:hypothetical protein
MVGQLYLPEFKMIKILLDAEKKINAQLIAFDFILDKDEPRIVEKSYCCALECCNDTPGYRKNN